MARSLLALIAVAVSLAAAPTAHAVVPPLKQPVWTDLSPEQKQILAPLAGEWSRLESFRQKKWLDIAERYPAMAPEEQSRMQRRMQDWVKLSPEERKAAREKYKNLQKAPPEQKEAVRQKWEEYKQLPEDEKQRLKDEAARKKTRPMAGSPAAPALITRPAPASPVPSPVPAGTPAPEPAEPAAGGAPAAAVAGAPPATSPASQQ